MGKSGFSQAEIALLKILVAFDAEDAFAGLASPAGRSLRRKQKGKNFRPHRVVFRPDAQGKVALSDLADLAGVERAKRKADLSQNGYGHALIVLLTMIRHNARQNSTPAACSPGGARGLRRLRRLGGQRRRCGDRAAGAGKRINGGKIGGRSRKRPGLDPRCSSFDVRVEWLLKTYRTLSLTPPGRNGSR